DGDRQSIEKTFKDAIAAVDQWKGLLQVELGDLQQLDRQLLVERQLISRELSESSGTRCVFIDPQETFSLMINEEDHLRMQVMHSGLDMETAYEQINRMDDLLAERVNYAFHDRLGYLTACPTNVGTGMRVSRAYGILCTAQTISSEETLHLLSSVRMGIYLGLIQDLEIPTINKLFIHTQPAHLQKLRGTELPSADRNVERAMYLQSHLRK